MISKIEKIICDDSQNITNWHNENNIALSIIKPPYIADEDLNDEYLIKIQNIIKQVAQVTKKGGICCLILDEDKNINQKMSSVSGKIFFQMMEPENLADWEKYEEIIWVKSPKSSMDSINHMKSGILINFEETPFATIHVFQRKGSEFEYIHSEEQISKLDIDDEIKEKWADSVWFVQPKKESKIVERVPFEILSRLIQIFSNKEEIILDPFAGSGGTAIVSKFFKRYFLCFDIDQMKINDILKNINNKITVNF